MLVFKAFNYVTCKMQTYNFWIDTNIWIYNIVFVISYELFYHHPSLMVVQYAVTMHSVCMNEIDGIPRNSRFGFLSKYNDWWSISFNALKSQ